MAYLYWCVLLLFTDNVLPVHGHKQLFIKEMYHILLIAVRLYMALIYTH